ncbi:MAG: ATP-binding cassette domain-containing protein, partial [Clostridium sp.]|nr:ATP-binding cassette domain-containing protein [Clostridium sp.]
MSRVILELKKVNCFYPMKGDLPFQAVKDVSLNVFEGEILGLMGESGSGKSTLAKAMLGTFVGCQGTIVY